MFVVFLCKYNFCIIPFYISTAICIASAKLNKAFHSCLEFEWAYGIALEAVPKEVGLFLLGVVVSYREV